MTLPNVPSLTQIIGAGAEGGHEFARICHHLLLHTANINKWHYDMCSDRAGDYKHLDGWSRNWSDLTDAVTGFQFKFYASPLSSAHKQDIKASLKNASESNPDMRQWILILPDDMTQQDQGWFDQLPRKTGLRVQSWGHTRLIGMFMKYPELCATYHPQLVDRSEHVVQTLKDIEQARTSQERITRTVDLYLQHARAVSQRIWGPGALLRSEIGGLSPLEFDKAVDRIHQIYGSDPIGERLRQGAQGLGVTPYEILQHALKQRYRPNDWNLERIAEEIKAQRT